MTTNMRSRIVDLVIAAAAIIVFLSYVHLVAEHVTPGMPSILSAVGLLVVLGFVSGTLMSTSLLMKVIFASLVPLAHVISAGGDSAKPNLEYVVGAVELLCICVGVVGGHLMRQRSRSKP